MDIKKLQSAEKTKSISGLDLDAFSTQDIVNTVLQRSEVLYDIPRSGRIIRAWSDGDAAPLLKVVAERGKGPLRRAAAVIYLEYMALKPLLKKLKPARIADIGCGYGFFDLFAARDLDAALLLIDLEGNNNTHFGFAETGSAYSSLQVAQEFLTANGVDPARIKTVNPQTSDVTQQRDIDLAVSFLSCGFHYPVSTYRTFFETSVAPDGALLLDVRTSGRARAQLGELAELGTVETLYETPKWRRVLVRKGG